MRPWRTAKNQQTAVFAGGLLLGYPGGLRTSQGSFFRDLRLRWWHVKSPPYESVRPGCHRPRRNRQHRLRSLKTHVRPAVDGFFLRRAPIPANGTAKALIPAPNTAPRFLHQRGTEAHRSGLHRAGLMLQKFIRGPIVTKLSLSRLSIPLRATIRTTSRTNPIILHRLSTTGLNGESEKGLFRTSISLEAQKPYCGCPI